MNKFPFKKIADEPPPDFNPTQRADRSVVEPPATPPSPETSAAPAGKSIFDPVPGDSQSPTSTQSKTSPRRSVLRLPAVKEMQNKILEFADVAASTDVTSMKGNQQGQQYAHPDDKGGIPSTRSGRDQEYVGGSDPFGNFLIQQYVKGDPVGKQYLNVDVSGNRARQDASIDNVNLRGMIDTIRRIGSPGAPGTEKTGDGIWQVRTNNALKNIYALTLAMVNFANDMKINIQGYDSKQLESFKGLIPKEYTELKTPADISKRAEDITPHIIAITNFFNNLKKTVFDNKDLRQYIDQKTPFAKYEKSSTLSKEMQNSKVPIKVDFASKPDGSTYESSITLSELSSMQNFKSFLKRIGLNDDPNTVKQILDVLSKKVNVSDPGY